MDYAVRITGARQGLVHPDKTENGYLADSNGFFVVPGTGIEPASLAAADFKSAVFTNFTIRAAAGLYRPPDIKTPVSVKAHVGTADVKPRSGG